MKPRTLIIGAESSADIARAANLVREYVNGGWDQRTPSGRYHGIVYGPMMARDTSQHAYVWHTASQITVHLGVRLFEACTDPTLRCRAIELVLELREWMPQQTVEPLPERPIRHRLKVSPYYEAEM